jgi:hypothetical protein
MTAPYAEPGDAVLGIAMRIVRLLDKKVWAVMWLKVKPVSGSTYVAALAASIVC